LFPHLRVRDNLAYGLRCRGRPASVVVAAVDRIAALVGVSHLLERWPDTLSGGEAQRIALGRVLAVEPRVLLLDEPLSSLDGPARAELCALMRRINRAGQTCLHVTHDMEEALATASRLGVIEDGRLVQVGPPAEVLAAPASPFVASLAGVGNVLAGLLLPRAGNESGDIECFQAGPVHFKIARGSEASLPDGPIAGNEGRGIEVQSRPPGCRQGLPAAPDDIAKGLVGASSGGQPGFLLFRGEDVWLARQGGESSACNRFAGTVVDLHGVRAGLEVAVDIGVRVRALITESSRQRLALAPGVAVEVGIKATAIRFLPGM
jgi:molybdopterin-binding protein